MNRKPNYWKATFIPANLLIAGGLLCWHWGNIFYEKPYHSFQDLPRLYGCIAFALVGFAALAAVSVPSRPDDMSFPWTYLWKFPFLCLLNAMAVFAVCQMFARTSGYLFNFIAYPAAFLGGLFSEISLPLLFKKAQAWSEAK